MSLIIVTHTVKGIESHIIVIVEGDFKRIVVLTGAGVSAESGIATFRAKDGLWENHRVEDVATPEAFERDPELVHRFYNARRAQHEGSLPGASPVEPNAAHHALSKFERGYAGEFLLVTQNIDALHEGAGSESLLHMHGELLKMRCVATGEVFPWAKPCFVQSPCECCGVPGRLRPHIVWFGEMPFYGDRIQEALSSCDLFVSIGTSGNVYPAAGFVRSARVAGARTVELNKEASQNAEDFDEVHYGLATEVVPAFFSKVQS